MGWETRNEGSCFFVWQQGITAPIAQKVDSEIATPLERRAQFRLPSEFTISYGKCQQCGYKFWDNVRCTNDDSGTWRTSRLIPPSVVGIVIDSDWLQCLECCDAFPLRPPKRLYICPSCQRLVHHVSRESNNEQRNT